VGLAVGAIAALALPSAASATTACTVGVSAADPTQTMVVEHSDDPADPADDAHVTITIRRVQSTLEVLEGATPVTCTGSSSLVTAVDRIDYGNSGGSSSLILEEPDTFAPGKTVEGVGDSEIETIVENSGGILDRVILRDGDGLPDHYAFGTSATGVNGVDVNPGDPAPDADITLLKPIFATFVAEGSPGADTFTGAGGPGAGGPYLGSLTLHGGPGNDTLVGTPGFDFFRNEPGDDLIDGGDGTDQANYSASTLPVDIDLARPGPQNGGSLGRDTLTSIEQVDGSPFNDVLRGTAGHEDLFGFAGDDLIEGRGGDDTLAGGDGVDTVSYESAVAPVAVDLALDTPQPTVGAGVDLLAASFENLIGGAAADILRGTAGPNVIEGRTGPDTILALEGDDTVLVRDGSPDTADCGPGNDRATVDPGGIDVVSGCESVSVGVAPGLPGASGTGGPGSSARHRVAASLKGLKSQRLVRGAITLRLACPVLSCAARATASTGFRLGAGPRKHRVTLLPARARILAGKSALLRLRLAPKGLTKVRAALAGGRRPAVRVRVVVTDAAAAKRTLHRTITLLP
jgi:Ca2+-binding RTX toxin-like protein